MNLKNLILSYDFVISIILTLGTALILPNFLANEFCKTFYSIGINVLSIIFAIFFATLSIIMASSDNDFISFLEEEHKFTKLLQFFKFTLTALFISLLYSIILF